MFCYDFSLPAVETTAFLVVDIYYVTARNLSITISSRPYLRTGRSVSVVGSRE